MRRILIRIALTAVLPAALISSLAGCDRGSAAYQKITDMPYAEWDQYALSLPIEERLDLHKEIIHRSGHTPPATISEDFQDNPLQTYQSIVRRIKSGDLDEAYIRVLYGIDESNDFKICNQPDRNVVQNYIRQIYVHRIKFEPPFYSC